MRRSLRCLLACAVIIPIFTVTVPGAGLQVATSDPGSATAIEQALIEQACSTTRTAGAPDTIGAFAGPPFDAGDIAGHLSAFEIGRRKS